MDLALQLTLVKSLIYAEIVIATNWWITLNLMFLHAGKEAIKPSPTLLSHTQP